MGEVRFMISEAAKQVHVESHVLRYWEEELNLKIGRTEMGHRYYTEDDIQLFCCIKKLKNEGMLLKDLKPLIPKLKETRTKLVKAKAEAEAGQKSAAIGEAENRLKSASVSEVKTELKSAPVSEVKTELKTVPVSEAKSEQKSAPVSEAKAEQKSALVSEAKDRQKSTPSQETQAKKQPAKETEMHIVPKPVVSAAEVIPVTQLEQVRGLIGDVLTEVVTGNNKALEKSISRKVTTDVIREMDFLFQAKERQEEEHYRKLDALIRQQQASRREFAEKATPIGRLKKMLT